MPGAGGLVGHGCAQVGARRVRIRTGTPAARRCGTGCSRCCAAAVPAGAALAVAGAWIAGWTLRSGWPWSPGPGGRPGRPGAAAALRPRPGAGTRPGPGLGRPVGPGPRAEPRVGARAEPLRATPGPVLVTAEACIRSGASPVRSRTGPMATGARPGTGIRPRAGAGPRAEPRIGMTRPPRARGRVRTVLRAGRGRKRNAGRRAVAHSPGLAGTRAGTEVSPVTRPAARLWATPRIRIATGGCAVAGIPWPAAGRLRPPTGPGTRVAAWRETTARTGPGIPARVAARGHAQASARIPARIAARCHARASPRIPPQVTAWNPTRIAARTPTRADARIPARIAARCHARASPRIPPQVTAWNPTRIAARNPTRIAARTPTRIGTWNPARIAARTRTRIAARNSARAEAGSRVRAQAGAGDGSPRRARIRPRITGRAQPRVRDSAPAWPRRARRACVTAVTCIAVGKRIIAEPGITVPGRPVLPAGIGRPAIPAVVGGKVLIGAGTRNGQAPTGVPRGSRTAVAHTGLSSPRHRTATAATSRKSLHHEAPTQGPPPFWARPLPAPGLLGPSVSRGPANGDPPFPAPSIA